ncbi:MAG: NUDIX domain-containing protein [Candidatus Pacebacteria bacterium]|jgi:ADP-ribose pyrophosphatase YjhB (NUDIX family)|nr:NUDIX domain-containing protein [Candidatus Paceibacterota bacterium]
MQQGYDYIGNAVTTFCHDGNGRCLLGLRSDKCRDEHGRWDPIGSGGIEVGDTIEDTVHREVKEECGSEVVAMEFLGHREVFREQNGTKTHWIQFDFKVQVNPDQVRIMEPEKCLALEWYTLDALPEPMHSQFPTFLEKYKDKLI